MKVRIEQSEVPPHELPKSFLDRVLGSPPKLSSPFFLVKLHVELTNEEKATIHQYNLGEAVLEETVLDPDDINSLIDQYNATPPFDEKKRASLKYEIDLFSEP